ncbi:hypothetical protein [Endozoicomonas montiporae]|nr:hypothetical protein [Endozoicomonas montiporae]
MKIKKTIGYVDLRECFTLGKYGRRLLTFGLGSLILLFALESGAGLNGRSDFDSRLNQLLQVNNNKRVVDYFNQDGVRDRLFSAMISHGYLINPNDQQINQDLSSVIRMYNDRFSSSGSYLDPEELVSAAESSGIFDSGATFNEAQHSSASQRLFQKL